MIMIMMMRMTMTESNMNKGEGWMEERKQILPHNSRRMAKLGL